MITVRNLEPSDIDGALLLQRKCFPEPFPEDLLWKREHLQRHLELFPVGQFVAVYDAKVIASASSTLISDENWERHGNWMDTVGGPMLETFDCSGRTVYGLDISVDPDFRGKGVARQLYCSRKQLVTDLGANRFGTACRIPGFAAFKRGKSSVTPEEYVNAVVAAEMNDRTLTPLLRLGMNSIGVVHEYMDDPESLNAAALLESLP